MSRFPCSTGCLTICWAICWTVLALAWSVNAQSHPGTEKALHHYDHAIAESPGGLDARLARTKLLIDVGNIEDAETDLLAIESHVPVFNTGFLRGLVLFQQQAFAAALSQFDRYLTDYPNDFNAYKMRGRCYLALNQQEKALADLTHAASLQIPFNPGLVVESATLAQNMGQPNLALQIIDQATTNQGLIPQLQLEAINILSQAGRYHDALTRINQLIDANSANPEWLIRKSQLLSSLTRNTDALVLLNVAEDALSSRKPTPWGQQKLAEIQSLRHQYKAKESAGS